MACLRITKSFNSYLRHGEIKFYIFDVRQPCFQDKNPPFKGSAINLHILVSIVNMKTQHAVFNRNINISWKVGTPDTTGFLKSLNNFILINNFGFIIIHGQQMGGIGMEQTVDVDKTKFLSIKNSLTVCISHERSPC